jgi:dihydroorotate dehydrogenase (fumarate)
VAADPTVTAADREKIDLDLIAAVRASVTIPLAVKLSPYYSALANFAALAEGAGADGLVLFNRFYQPDLDLESMEVVARVELSRPGELRLPLRWIAILRPQLGGHVSIAATSGVHSGADVIKGLMVGADVVMTTSALCNGPTHLRASGWSWSSGSRSTSTSPWPSCAAARPRRRSRTRRCSSAATT